MDSSNGTKSCSKCGESKPIDRFRRNKTSKDGRRNDCKDCQEAVRKVWYSKNRQRLLLKAKAYRESNVESVSAIKKEWYQRNRDRLSSDDDYKRNRRLGSAKYRAIVLGVHWEDFTWNELIEYWDSHGIDPGVCFYCNDGSFEHLEHYVSMKNGGGHTMSNCRPSCSYCNHSKGDKPPEAFIEIINSNGTLKWCPDCESVLSLSSFANSRSEPDGKNCYCRGCASARRRP